MIVNGRDLRLSAAVERAFMLPCPTPQWWLSPLIWSRRMAVPIAAAGDVDILVNNLGIFEPRPFTQIETPSGVTFMVNGR